MFDFERKFITPADIQAVRPAKTPLMATLRKEVLMLQKQRYGRFDAAQIIAAMLLTLGLDRVKILLGHDIVRVAEMAGLVINDHMQEDGIEPKDLQVNLLINIVAMLTRNAEVSKTNSFLHAENIVRTLDLPPQLKLKIKSKLFDESVLFTNKVWITRVD